MIPIPKLVRVGGMARLRKAVLVLTEIQRGLMQARYGQAELSYCRDMAQALLAGCYDPGMPRGLAEACTTFLSIPEAATVRDVDTLRHALMRISAQSSADWDLIDPATGRLDTSAPRRFSGLTIYCDALRSPFNLGAVFRSAEAFGAGLILLSPGCADPEHPRCQRSAMGATASVPWRQGSLEDLETLGPAFALELGGEDIGDFRFPDSGIVVLGSEELGVSPEAARRCSLGRVSIPLHGSKASLNVAVAAGILLHAWSAALESSTR